MFNKIYLTLLTAFLFAHVSFGAERAQAFSADRNNEQLRMPYSTIAPFLNMETKLGQTVASGVVYENYDRPEKPDRSAVTTDYYPVKFYEEYLYRDNDSQPIRDFRSYKVKTFVPERESLNREPIRDFRTEMWKNKHYK